MELGQEGHPEPVFVHLVGAPGEALYRLRLQGQSSEMSAQYQIRE